MIFKTGDVCEVIGYDTADHMLGKIVIIHSGPHRYRHIYTKKTYLGYKVIIEGNSEPDPLYCPRAEFLRKLPPKQGTTTWEDIQQITGWVPNKQGVES